MVELKTKLLTRIKSQAVEKKNFTTIVNLVVHSKVHNEASYALKVILSRYLKDKLGSVDKLSTFMSEHSGLDGQTLVSVLDIASKIPGVGGDSKDGIVEYLASSHYRGEIVRQFLMFSKFPVDRVEEMVEMFINAGGPKLAGSGCQLSRIGQS